MTTFKLTFHVFITFTFVWTTLCQKAKARATCEFPLSTNENETSVGKLLLTYNADFSRCLDCTRGSDDAFKTLVKRTKVRQKSSAQKNKLCKMKCNGVLCGNKEDKLVCYPAERISRQNDQNRFKGCHLEPSQPEPNQRSKNQVPLIIGFAVGGVMLAVIIAGIYLGRSNKGGSPRDSDVATTPVSMSYSEWISNYSTGGRGSKVLNHRVQEDTGSQCSLDAYQSGDVYKIVYDDSSLERFQGNPSGPTIIEVDETLGVDDSFQEFSGNYFPDSVNDPFSPIHEGTNLLYDVDQPVETGHRMDQPVQISHSTEQPAETGHVTAAKEEPNNNRKGPKASQACFCKDNCVGWPNCIHFAPNSPAVSNKRKSLGQWSDESEMERRNLQLGSSCGSGFYGLGSERTSRSSIKSCRRSKSLRLNYANMTHVFADVHRNMTYSCDDLCSTSYESTSYRRDSGYLQTGTSNHSMRYLDSFLKIETDLPRCESRKKSYDNFFNMRQIRTTRRCSF